MSEAPVFTVDAVVGRYVELRAEMAVIAERHKAELEPLATKMKAIESWLMEKLNTDGVESYRTEHGTAYKTVATSVTMGDKPTFIRYILEPLAVEVQKLLSQIPGYKEPKDAAELIPALEGLIRWNVTDLRAGKKGILEELEQGSPLPPGVNMSSVATVNVRKS